MRCGADLPPDRFRQCAACDHAIEAERIAQDERAAAERFDSALRRSGLPLAYVNGTRSIADVRDVEAIAAAKAAIRGDLRGLFVYGPAGPDKTTLAAGALVEWIRAGSRGRYAFVPDLLSDIQATYSDVATITRNDLVKPLIDAPMLVLDDLGKEKPSEHAAGVIFQILDGRYRALGSADTRRPLIITSNYSLPQLVGRFRDDAVAEPICRRIEELTASLAMTLDA